MVKRATKRASCMILRSYPGVRRRLPVDSASRPPHPRRAGYEGISVDAPVYAKIEGHRAGDTFSYAVQEHRIDLVV
jgi:hypothetical protein